MAIFAAILFALSAPEPGRAHSSGECDHTLALTVRLAEGKARVAGWLLNELNTFRDTEQIISLVSTYLDTDTLFMETSKELINCLNR